MKKNKLKLRNILKLLDKAIQEEDRRLVGLVAECVTLTLLDVAELEVSNFREFSVDVDLDATAEHED